MVTRKSGRAKPEGGVPFTFELVAREDAHASATAMHGHGTGQRHNRAATDLGENWAFHSAP